MYPLATQAKKDWVRGWEARFCFAFKFVSLCPRNRKEITVEIDKKCFESHQYWWDGRGWETYKNVTPIYTEW